MTDDFGPEPHELQHQVAEAIEEVKEEFSLIASKRAREAITRSVMAQPDRSINRNPFGISGNRCHASRLSSK